MSWLSKFEETVKKANLKLVLSEGDDERVIRAAEEIMTNKLAGQVFLIGNPETIKSKAESIQVTLGEVEIMDPETSQYREQFAERLTELRSQDFPDKESALKAVSNRLYFGTLMHEAGIADLHITGAVETSSEVIKAFFHIIKTNRKEGVATSFFFMNSPVKTLGQDGAFLFSDCAVNIDPGARQLARIALQVGSISKNIFGFDTRLALLSFSTKGSGQGDPVDRVLEAGKELDKLSPDFVYEVEMQADAAIVPEVSDRKAPGNKTKGQSNVLIFPDLQSGNIGYKLVERFGSTRAYGPVIVGLNKVASDLSRGCSFHDITGTFIISAYYMLKK